MSGRVGSASAGRDTPAGPLLSMVIPCYNEEAVVRDTHGRLKAACEALGSAYEIIFGNDGSSDRTLPELEAIAAKDSAVRVVSHFPNRGAGYTYRQMYAAARGGIIVQMDADLAVPPEVALPALMDTLRDCEVAVGSRYAGITPDYPLKRRIFSRGYILINQLLFNLEVLDTQTGCIGFYRDILPLLDLRADGFEALLEFIVQAQGCGLRVTEVGLPWFHDTTSGETAVLSESVKMLAGTLKLRCRLGRKWHSGCGAQMTNEEAMPTGGG